MKVCSSAQLQLCIRFVSSTWPLLCSHDDIQSCVIYLCATMWHETYDEMLKILTSMFRLETRFHVTRQHRRQLLCCLLASFPASISWSTVSTLSKLDFPKRSPAFVDLLSGWIATEAIRRRNTKTALTLSLTSMWTMRSWTTRTQTRGWLTLTSMTWSEWSWRFTGELRLQWKRLPIT